MFIVNIVIYHKDTQKNEDVFLLACSWLYYLFKNN